MNLDIASIRQEYSLKQLSKKEVLSDPIAQFRLWFEEASQSDIKDVNAMTLSTVDKNSNPNSRTILLKSIEDEGIVFFSNYKSQKGIEIDNNLNVCALFFWKELERQVKFIGKVKKSSLQDSETYFHSRPLNSQIAAWASEQSQKINNRETLEEKFLAYKNKFKEQVAMHENWGGYLLIPRVIEFWQGRESRLHDRIVYELSEQGSEKKWIINRLQP